MRFLEAYCKHLARNGRGRDLVIGDIHGHFSRVERELDRVRFDPSRDRLICVGDLVDRGPESHQAAEWLAQPWFHSVIGNHDAAILHREGMLSSKFELFFDYHGWFDALATSTRARLCELLASLPWALEVQTSRGAVGVVHAEVPERFRSWRRFIWALTREKVRSEAISNRGVARQAADLSTTAEADSGRLYGIDWLIHGHTPRRGCRPGRLGNRIYIDTMGWYDQPVELGEPHFTLIDVEDPLTVL